jgi:hypothetical protein
MADAPRSDHSASTDELPDEIYIGFVDGLLADVVPVVVLSAVAVTVGEIAAAVAAKCLILAVAAPAQLLIAAVRLQSPGSTRETSRAPPSKSPACASASSPRAPLSA